MRHTDREYEQELESLREHVLLMGARVEELLSGAMQAFDERNAELAGRIAASDERVDQLEVEIDEMALRILARRQPVASDLRFITTTLKLVTDLERVADLGVNICERVIECGDSGALPMRASLQRMAVAALGMFHDSLDAFVAGDVLRARQVIARDREVDAYYAQLFPEFVSQLVREPASVEYATRMQAIGKYLERIADHATNLAEMVEFMVRGQDVRHGAGKRTH
jgi:phosphate transport system protein